MNAAALRASRALVVNGRFIARRAALSPMGALTLARPAEVCLRASAEAPSRVSRRHGAFIRQPPRKLPREE
jgi:hypothetical protein